MVRYRFVSPNPDAIMRKLAPLCLFLGLAAGDAPGISAQEPPRVADPVAGGAPPPGHLFEVDGVSLHLHCVGSKVPTVVIDAGAGAWSLAWLHIQEAIAPFTKTCVYDRAGLGWSEERDGPRTATGAARELRALLESAGEEPPFALVGHSYGGWVVRIFADLYREDVAGLALVESAHPDQWARLPPLVKRLLDAALPGIAARADSAAAGQLAADAVAAHGFFSGHPFLETAYRSEMVDPAHHRTYLNELRGTEESADRARRVQDLGTLPLVVVSAARGFDTYRSTPIPVDEANRIWLELQEELARLSTDMVHVVSRTGPHTIQYSEPGVVVGAIRELVERIRARADGGG